MQETMFSRATPELKEVAISKIGKIEKGATSATSKGINRFGFTSTVLLKRVSPYDEDGVQKEFVVVDGLGRVNDALDQHLTIVPALILGEDTNDVDVEMLRASMNLNRRFNEVQEALALKRVFDKCLETGMNQADITPYISKSSGIPLATLEQRLSLFELPQELQSAVIQGLVSAKLVTKIVNLSQPQQQDLIAVYQREGKLTGQDISEVRTVKTQAAVEALPFELFGDDSQPREVNRVGVSINHGGGGAGQNPNFNPESAISHQPSVEHDPAVALQHAKLILEQHIGREIDLEALKDPQPAITITATAPELTSEQREFVSQLIGEKFESETQTLSPDSLKDIIINHAVEAYQQGLTQREVRQWLTDAFGIFKGKEVSEVVA
ncbi:MAG: hypothetical protein ACRCVX_14325 [Shewanella sp.]